MRAFWCRFFLQPTLLLSIAAAKAHAEDRFALFVRESPTGDWDGMRSTIWEVVVPDEEGDPTFTRKLDFGKSHWAPGKFFFGRDLSPEVDRWIRIQRNVGDDFDVALCEVDFENWTQKQHFRAPRIFESGLTDQHGFFSVKDEGMFRIHFKETKIEEQKPAFKIECEFKDSWLVRFDGAPDEEMSLISRDGERIFQKVTLESLESGRKYRTELSRDRRWLAFFFYEELKQYDPATPADNTIPFPPTPVSPDFFSQPGQVKCKLVLFDFEKDVKFTHSFQQWAKPGSGVGTRIGFGAEFSENNSTLKFLAAGSGRTDSAEDEYDQVTLELETKAISREKFGKEKRSGHSDTGFIEVPAYLQASYDDLKENHWPDQRLALALIRQIGKYDSPVPTTWNETRVGYSRDGKRFLLNSLQGEKSEFFFFGDVEKRLVKKVKIPKELHRRHLEIYPIP